MNLTPLPDDLAPLSALSTIAIVLIAVIVHIAFAAAVWNHASRLTRRPVFVSPIIWAAATLVGGVFVAALYWAMHESTLSRWGSGTATSNAEE